MTEYIWFKHSKNRNSIHKRNKNIDKAKLDQLVKDGWVQIVGEANGVMDRTLVEKPKPKPAKVVKPKPSSSESKPAGSPAPASS